MGKCVVMKHGFVLRDQEGFLKEVITPGKVDRWAYITSLEVTENVLEVLVPSRPCLMVLVAPVS